MLFNIIHLVLCPGTIRSTRLQEHLLHDILLIVAHNNWCANFLKLALLGHNDSSNWNMQIFRWFLSEGFLHIRSSLGKFWNLHGKVVGVYGLAWYTNLIIYVILYYFRCEIELSNLASSSMRWVYLIPSCFFLFCGALTFCVLSDL